MTRKNKPLRQIQLKIEALTPRGNGFAIEEKSDGSTTSIEAPFTIPGDEVELELYRRKRKGYKQSKVLQILTPSSDRIDPKCQHFGSCGGCRWQQISYDQQLKIKTEVVEGIFNSLLPDSSLLREIVPSDPIWHYRNKMEFSFSQDREGNRFLGLIQDSTRGKVLNLTDCHLPRGWVAKTLDLVRGWWTHSNLDAFHLTSNQGSLRTLITREGMKTGDRMVMLTVSGNPNYALNKEQINSFVTTLKEQISPEKGELSLFLRIQQAEKGRKTQFFEISLSGPEFIQEKLTVLNKRELTFQISPSAFFQPNSYQAEKLYSYALEAADIQPESVVYDLYCGTGTMALCAATVAKHVIGIELSLESSLDARENGKRNEIDNLTIHTGDVGEVLAKIMGEPSFLPSDIVLLDPPRSGLDQKAIDHVLSLKPKKIVYVSCNPKTQGENITQLTEGGYKLLSVRPFDQFPHTVHIECVALLELYE